MSGDINTWRGELIYLNYAATSGVKPDSVMRAIERFYRGDTKYMPNRSAVSKKGHADILTTGRRALGELFKIKTPERIVFQANATQALNLAIMGSLDDGDHVVATVFEHNSVLRPLEYLRKTGKITYELVAPGDNGIIDPADIEKALKPATKLIIINHASNVSGVVQQIDKIGAVAKNRGIPMLVDASQSAGVIDIDVERDGISLLAFTGHKGLYGPTGTGGLYISEGLELNPVLHGGTGSFSETLEQPTVLPDRFETGTLNVLGINALTAGVKFVLETTSAEIHEHEELMRNEFLERAGDIDGIRFIGPGLNEFSTGVVSLVVDGEDSNEIGSILFNSFSILVRAGLHCAPKAHEYYGTLKTGTVRLSFGYFTDLDEVDSAAKALEAILRSFSRRK